METSICTNCGGDLDGAGHFPGCGNANRYENEYDEFMREADRYFTAAGKPVPFPTGSVQ